MVLYEERFITKRYKFIIIFWIVLAIVLGVFAIRLPAILDGDGFRMDGEHEDVMAIATDSIDFPAETLFLVFEDLDDKQDRSKPWWRTWSGTNIAINAPLEDAY